MGEKLRLTITYDEPDEDGWIVAHVVAVPGAVSQGRTREEARENVIDALRLVLSPDEEDAGVAPGRSEPRQINELQRDAPEIIKEAEMAPVVITKYGKTVAVIESPEQYRHHQELHEAAERALWAIDIQHALADLKKGRTVPWDEAITRLRARFPGR